MGTLTFPIFSGVLSFALQLASDGLSQNVVTVKGDKTSKQYLLAGSHQYHSLWAWDFAFASYGALQIGETQAVHDSLEIYFSNQRKDGLLPRVIDRHKIGPRVLLGLAGIVLPFKAPLKPQFETENHVISYIPNVILPWTASRYVEFTQDLRFAREYFPRAEKAIAWIDAKTLKNGLVCKQAPFSDWQDSIARTGCVAFTNVLYGLSLRGLSDWAKFIGDDVKSAHYQTRYLDFQSKFRAYFWNSEKQHLRNFTGNHQLSADANLLAVAYGLVDERDSKAIMKTLRASPLWEPYPGRATWPNYPKSMKSKFPRMVGLAGYHDQIRWGWLTALAAIAERRVGNEAQAQEILETYAQQIAKDKAVCEVYDYKAKKQTIKPVKRLFYRAERPFTWSSGLFIEASLHP